MGSQQVESGANQSRMREFTRAVLEDLDGLEHMIKTERFEKGVRRIGAEQEMFLIDSARQPAPIAVELLDALKHDARVTTELARFNLEANLSPQVFGGGCLRAMENELKSIIEMVDTAAQSLGGGVALTGILPTLRLAHLTLDNMTPNPRYFELNRAISAVNDGAFSIVIKGLDELDITHDNVLMEAANTSFQVHFQVAPHEFAALYNLAQAISAPVLAAAVNSPLMLGQRLWQETRVALFQRSVDARSTAHKMRAKPTRVSFGDHWIHESIVEIYKDDIARYRVMLSSDVDEHPLKVLRDGGVPELRALRMHTSTVWRWNRACYGVRDGEPHLRIENRILPAGPTVIDEIANAAFFFGLMASMADEYPRIDHVMSFDDAKANFFAAARHGLNAQFTWIGGKTQTAADLIMGELLPNAKKGLSTHGIDQADIDRYLGVIEERVRTSMTGSQWALRSLARMNDAPLDVRMRSLVAAIAKHQRRGEPVHTWPLAQLYRTRDWFPSYRTVGQFMSTDIYTVRPSDPIDLVARMMEWQQIRHVPVEDDHGILVGLVSFRDLLHLIGHPEDRPENVEQIMLKEPTTVRATTPTLEALTMMREKNIGSLPVVDEDNRLIGLVTVYDLLGIAAKVLEDFLRGEEEKPETLPPPGAPPA